MPLSHVKHLQEEAQDTVKPVDQSSGPTTQAPTTETINTQVGTQGEAQSKQAKLTKAEEFIRNCSPELLERLKTMTESEYMSDASMEAVPFELPEMLSCRSKDPLYILRWVNHKGHGGSRLGKMKAIGFVAADEQDVEGLDPQVFKPGQAGRYEFHDVVLMKIHKLRYYQALKANQVSSQRVSTDRGNIHKLAKNEADTALNQAGLGKLMGKVSTFIPGEEEATALNR